MEYIIEKAEKMKDREITPESYTINPDNNMTVSIKHEPKTHTISDRINELNFTIDKISKDKKENKYYSKDKDIYHCHYKDWSFTVQEHYDPEVTILAMENIKNSITSESLDLYCDLWNNNTSENRLNRLVRLMDMGVENFMDSEFGEYIKLPILLRSKGYEIEEKDFNFNFQGTEGYLEVKQKGKPVCYIRIYLDYGDEIKCAVSNTSMWDRNCKNDFFNQKAYCFNYKNENDIDNFCTCINSFIRELEDKYGYKEDGIYYRNEHLEEITNSLEKYIAKYYFNEKAASQGDILIGYDEKLSKRINLYEGKEVNYSFLITFSNKKLQENKNSVKEQYTVSIVYDKKENSDKCILKIDSEYLIGEEDSMLEKDRYKTTGSFTDIIEELKFFIHEIYNTHNMVVKI